MAEITGVAIADITESGWSDDGRHIWITHRLHDGSTYRLIYPSEAAGYLVTTINYVVRSAFRQVAAGDPQQTEAGLNTAAMPVDLVRVGTSPDNSGAILHLTTADEIPIAVEMPVAILEEMARQLRRVLENLQAASPAARRLH